jgi:uncharacterized membrane protein YbhN (UPF0104 family)
MTSRARALLAVKAVVSLALLAWLGARIAEREGMDALVARLGTLAIPPIAAAIALHVIAVIAGVLRWRVLLDARGLGQPFGWLLRSFLIGRFIGAFTPSTTGLDGWRSFDVARRTGDVVGSASVILVEKLIGLVGMAMVCAAVAPFGAIDRLGRGALPLALAIALGAGFGLWLLATPARTRRLAAAAPRPLRARAERFAEALASGGLHAGRLAGAVGLGIVSHLALSAVFAATGLALGVDVDPMLLVAVGNAIVIAVLLPVSIGGVGVREGVAVFLLAGAGATDADAVLIALLGYLTGQVPALVGGILLAIDRDARRARDEARPSTPAAPGSSPLSRVDYPARTQEG